MDWNHATGDELAMALRGWILGKDLGSLEVALLQSAAGRLESSGVRVQRLAAECWARNPGEKIQAIKDLREAAGLSLKDAKEAIEAVAG